MGSDEERLEEMLKAVMREENKRAGQKTQPDLEYEEELPEMPAEDFGEELPEMPAEDFGEDLPEIPAEDFGEELPEMPAEDFGEDLPEMPMEDFGEDLPEMPMEDFGEDLPEIPAEDFGEELPEMPAEDFGEDLPEMPMEDFGEDLPEMPMEDFGEDLPEISAEDFGEELPGMPAEDYAEKLPEKPVKLSEEKEMAVDPLKLLEMSEEELDKVLEEEAALGEMFTGKAKEDKVFEQPEENDALSDIQEMLQMSDNHVLVDESARGKGAPVGEMKREDAQSLSENAFGMEYEGGEGLDAGPAEKKGKPKKERKKKKEKEKKKEDNGEKEKSFVKNIVALFFGSDDDDLEEAEVEKEKEKEKGKKKGKGNSADAGDGGEVKGKKKKEKNKKPPKKEKEKNPAKAAKEKQQKEKKAEKARIKAEKAQEAEKEKRAAKKLPKKRVIVWVLLCASIGAGILLINSMGMAAIQLTEARNAFTDRDFETAYRLMNGRELSEEDRLIFRQSSAVLHLRHAEEAYNNHLKLEKPVKALEDLLKGVRKYQELVQLYGDELVTPELTAQYQRILEILGERYALSEAGALEINAIRSDYEYSLQLEALVNGEAYQSEAETKQQEEEAEQAFPELEDMLPEEEEHLNGSGD